MHRGFGVTIERRRETTGIGILVVTTQVQALLIIENVRIRTRQVITRQWSVGVAVVVSGVTIPRVRTLGNCVARVKGSVAGVGTHDAKRKGALVGNNGTVFARFLAENTLTRHIVGHVQWNSFESPTPQGLGYGKRPRNQIVIDELGIYVHEVDLFVAREIVQVISDAGRARAIDPVFLNGDNFFKNLGHVDVMRLIRMEVAPTHQHVVRVANKRQARIHGVGVTLLPGR